MTSSPESPSDRKDRHQKIKQGDFGRVIWWDPLKKRGLCLDHKSKLLYFEIKSSDVSPEIDVGHYILFDRLDDFVEVQLINNIRRITHI